MKTKDDQDNTDPLDLSRYKTQLIDSSALTLRLCQAAVEFDCALRGKETSKSFQATKQIAWALRRFAGADECAREDIVATTLYTLALRKLGGSSLATKTMVQMADLLARDDNREYWTELSDFCVEFGNQILNHRQSRKEWRSPRHRRLVKA